MKRPKLDSTSEKTSRVQQPNAKHQTQTPNFQEAIPPQHDLTGPLISRMDNATSAEVHAAILNRTTGGRLSRSSKAILQLQRKYGNRYVQRVLSIARQGSGSAGVKTADALVGRQECEEEEGESIQGKRADALGGRQEFEEEEGETMQGMSADGIQTKLSLSSPGDDAEKEAERVAEQVSASYESGILSKISRSELSGVDVSKVLGMAGGVTGSEISQISGGMSGMGVFTNNGGSRSAEQPAVSPSVERRIIASRGVGSPLPAAIRNTMALQTGYDLGDVRVKTGSEAADLNGKLHARAFTLGSDIWLGRNESVNDVKLMAHELTHVVQQGAAKRISAQRVAEFDGMKSKSKVTSYLQALTNGKGHDPSLYAKEIDQFRKDNTADAISALQRQILDAPKTADMNRKSDSSIMRACSCKPSGGTTPRAVPVNFRQTAGRDAGDHLHFEYAWDSSSGSLGDLSNVELGEHVSYPGGFTDPPFKPRPNPTIIWLPGTSGGLQDNHTSSLRKPYRNATLGAVQYYRYRIGGGRAVNLMGPSAIEREVARKADGNYKWSVTKSGLTAEIDPLP